MRSFDERPDPSHRRPPAAVRRTEDGPAAVDSTMALTPVTAMRLQRLVGNATVRRLVDEGEASPVLDIVGRGGGHPLEPDVRTDMEQRLGHDFGDVRIHTDGAAAASATSVQAHAYTVSNEIVFNEGRYDPSSSGGRETLAHELTHVVQQRSGPVDGTPADGGIQLSDPTDRFEQEAEHTARQAVGAEEVSADTGAAASAASGGSGGSVQREGGPDDEKKDEDEPVQGVFAQREDELEKKDETA